MSLREENKMFLLKQNYGKLLTKTLGILFATIAKIPLGVKKSSRKVFEYLKKDKKNNIQDLEVDIQEYMPSLKKDK